MKRRKKRDKNKYDIKLKETGTENPLAAYFGPLPYLCGLDFMKTGLYLDWPDSYFLKHLQEFKEEFLDESLCPDRNVEWRPLRLDGGLELNMHRNGAGKYPYFLKTGDIHIMFSNHKSDAQCPNCRIEIGSLSCWNPGYEKVFNKIVQWIRAFGGTIRKQKLSEFHPVVDLLNVDFNKTGFDDVTRWVSLAKKYNIHGEYRTPNYIAFGKGDLMLRIYHKTGELAENAGDAKDRFFQSLWANHLQSLPPKHVTRIEFQIRRTNIKQLEINTVGDLVKKLNSIWAYCCREWARFHSTKIKEEDRKKKSYKKYKTAFIWDFVCNIRFNEAKVYKVKRKRFRGGNVEALQKQMAGCAISICGILGLAPDDFDSHIAQSVGLLFEQMEANRNKSFVEYERKIKVAGVNSELSNLLF
jgi:hypothetical protein